VQIRGIDLIESAQPVPLFLPEATMGNRGTGGDLMRFNMIFKKLREIIPAPYSLFDLKNRVAYNPGKASSKSL
jgi:hypothetical protein